jgi:serine/threonine protein kinase
MIESGAFLQQRYRIDKQIGQGGMGAVYLATDERFNSTVAIKETLCMNDSFRKALEREARLLNSLKHSALPRVSDHFLEDEGQFLVMEYVPGDDLMQTLERQGKPFQYEQVLNWADQILDALDYLHNQENPVIHRDIKPQNLKVTPKGQVILLDFGLAKGNVTDAGNLTAAKSIFGYSRNYASLEQIQGTGTDPRSDLYSLSATVYHLITGVAPEDALTRAMAVLSNQLDPLLPATSVNPAIPAGIAAVLHNSLDLTAGRRPTSALDLRNRLREFDRYSGQLNLSSRAFPSPTDGSIFGAPTVANPDSTWARGGQEAVTQLLPDGRSQVTSIRDARSNGERVPQATSGGPASKRMRYILGGAFAVIAVCAASIGLYEFGDSLFGTTPATNETQKVESQAAEKPVTNISVTETSSNSEAASALAGAPEEPSAPMEKRTAAAKPAANTAAHSNSNDDFVFEDQGEKIVINGKSLTAGNVKIANGMVFTPQGTFPLNKQFPPNVQRPNVPIDPSTLTPEQRRRLRMLRQNHPEVFVKPPPQPSPNN